MANILSFKSPDMVNLQGWLHKAPKEFNRAVTNITNTIAKDARLEAIKNIEKSTNTRNKSFVRRSMRFTKAEHGKSLNQIVATMGSIDISDQGRSSGFEELETGVKTKNPRVPTMGSRRGNESKTAARTVRLDMANRAFHFRQFKGKGIRTKNARVARMLMAIRKGAIGAKPFIVPRGLSGKMSRMEPGIYRKKKGGLFLDNPFKDNVVRRTRRIKWATKAAQEVTKDSNLKAVWDKEVDFVLKKRK